MSKSSLPRWLSVLIGLVIVVVVGSVVFYSINVMNRVAVKTTAKPHSTATFARSFSINAMSTKNVFLIMMENHNWSDIKNNPSAPYINNTLLPTASYAEQYYNPPGNHPSEPNYLWLEAGTNFGISDDADPDFNHQSTSQHLVTLLSTAGISWKSYQEDISGTDCPLTGSGLYAPKHNPMVFFDDVTNANDPNSSNCISHIRPYTELTTDLQQNTEANYNLSLIHISEPTRPY